MEARERDLGGAGQVEVVGLERVDVRALGREEAGAVHRLLAHEHRRQQRRVAVRGRAVEREAVERHRDERRVADEVAEARAREPRGALHLEAADLGVLGPVRRRVADAAQLDGVLVGVAVRRRRVGRIRHEREQRVALGLGGRRAPPRARAAPPSRRFSSSSCSGVGLPFSFWRPRSSSTRGTSARQRSSAASSASKRSRRALARERGAKAVRVGARGAKVDHARESRSASSTEATPSSAAGGQIQSATAFTRGVRVLDRDPVAGPLDQLDVVLAVAERDRLLGA